MGGEFYERNWQKEEKQVFFVGFDQFAKRLPKNQKFSRNNTG